MSSRASEDTPPVAELLADEVDEVDGADRADGADGADVHPAGKLTVLASSVGLRVMALAGFAVVAAMAMGVDGPGGSTCC
ncbi:MAG TPA: hypothetical protein VJ914_29795 [Pseudonocardiaceae bacterium]|nr:hypothetical protein [Pseudonocardiaceae bacterium]